MAKLTPEKVAQHMVGLLPQDGTPVLNRVMRVMLARELESPVDSELYFGDSGRGSHSRGECDLALPKTRLRPQAGFLAGDCRQWRPDEVRH
jgi:hypothetical protein